MFGFCPLASGSKGNCLFVGGETRILIDAGLSVMETMEKLHSIGIDPKSIEAILVTHEHSDHIKGLAKLSMHLQVPVLANASTAKAICASLKQRPRFKIFTTGEPFRFGDLEIFPFSIPHDTLDPVGFTIRLGETKLGICADLGHVTSFIKRQLEGCTILYVEANHKVSMVHSSSRPAELKKRILGKLGHLSNEECAELIDSVHHARLKQVYLAHLSEECNTEELALQTVGSLLDEKGKKVPLLIAHQLKISQPVFF